MQTEQLLIALDASTEQVDIALFQKENCIAQHHFQSERKAPAQLIDHIALLLSKSNFAIRDINHFAIGVGPGNFSSLRIACATINAMALPYKSPITAISTAHVLIAGKAAQTMDTKPIAVIGDARRDHIWFCLKNASDNLLDSPIRTIPLNRLPTELPATASHLISPDWKRLQERVEPLLPQHISLPQSDARPQAMQLGKLALQTPPPAYSPAQPLYVHPPVFVPPRFPPT